MANLINTITKCIPSGNVSHLFMNLGHHSTADWFSEEFEKIDDHYYIKINRATDAIRLFRFHGEIGTNIELLYTVHDDIYYANSWTLSKTDEIFDPFKKGGTLPTCCIVYNFIYLKADGPVKVDSYCEMYPDLERTSIIKNIHRYVNNDDDIIVIHDGFIENQTNNTQIKNWRTPYLLNLCMKLPESERTCPICQDVISDIKKLHVTECYHLFHKSCQSEWKKKSNKCAMCNSE